VSGGRTELVPVLADFGFQRFTERAEDDGGLREQGRRVKLESQHGGWVKMPRKRVDELVKVGYPPAINVYLLLLLMADQKQGSCHPSRATIGAKLRLSDKQVRTALEKLQAGELIEKDGKVGRANLWWISGFTDMQDRAEDNYFKLYRNLRDEGRAELFGDPVLLRLWIRSLAAVRYKPDTDGVVDVGEFLLKPAAMAEELGIKPDEVEEGFGKLAGQGRVELRQSDGARVVRVINWRLYHGNYIYRANDDAGQKQGAKTGPIPD